MTGAARPTTYKGVRMRSRLEAGFAAWLDWWLVEWEYEPCAFADPVLGQYLPDFLVRGVGMPDGSTSDLYVEVKPRGFADVEDWSDWADRDECRRLAELHEYLCRAVEIIKASDPLARLALCAPGESVALSDHYGAWGVVEWNGAPLFRFERARQAGGDPPLPGLHLVNRLAPALRPWGWSDNWWEGPPSYHRPSVLEHGRRWPLPATTVGDKC